MTLQAHAAAFESTGPGGSLKWSQRRDGHWHADTPRGHFDVVPMKRGHHLWWRGRGEYVDLGHQDFLGGAFGAAQRYLDEGVVPAVAAEEAKECCGDDKCAHRHPPSVPTTACEADGKLQWSELYKSSKSAIYHAPTDHPHEAYYIQRLSGKKFRVEFHSTERAPIKVTILGRENSLEKAKEVAQEHYRARQSTHHLPHEANESLAEAPRPMHVEIPPDAYAQWVAFGDKIGPVDTTEKIYRLLSPEVRKYDQEVFLVVVTDLHFKLRSVTEVGRGERSSVGVGIEEVMRAALMTPGGAHFMCAHNHPSSKCSPSKADRDLHASIEEAAKSYASLTYLDHVVIGVDEYYSIRENKKYKVK